MLHAFITWSVSTCTYGMHAVVYMGVRGLVGERGMDEHMQGDICVRGDESCLALSYIHDVVTDV